MRGRGWRRAGGRARCPRRCRASGGPTELQPPPAPAPGQRGRARHLGARNAVKPALLPQRSADPLPTLCSAFHQISALKLMGTTFLPRWGVILNFLSSNK